VARIHIGTETESPGAWKFQITISEDPAPPREITARLAWPDYNHWTNGSVPPAHLIEQIARFLAAQVPHADLPSSFDAAAIRRKYPALDEYLAERLAG
jgi:hypothetical protein